MLRPCCVAPLYFALPLHMAVDTCDGNGWDCNKDNEPHGGKAYNEVVHSNGSAVVLSCLSGGGFGNFLKAVLNGIVYATQHGAAILVLPWTSNCDLFALESGDVDAYREYSRQRLAEALRLNLTGTWGDNLIWPSWLNSGPGGGGTAGQNFVQQFMPTLPMTLDISRQHQFPTISEVNSLLSGGMLNENCTCCAEFLGYTCNDVEIKGDMLAWAAQEYVAPYVACPAMSEIGPKTLVLHVRWSAMGKQENSRVFYRDSYFQTEQCDHPQPPCVYYEDIISNDQWSDVVVVTPSEDRGSEQHTGCAQRILDYALKLGLRARLQSGSVFEDACTLHRARNVALSFSSWAIIFGVYLGLKHKRSVFWPFGDGDLRFPAFLPDFWLHSPPPSLWQCLYSFPEFACVMDRSFPYRPDNLADYPRRLLKYTCSV